MGGKGWREKVQGEIAGMRGSTGVLVEMQLPRICVSDPSEDS